jgi:hypothetical protein
VVNIHVDVGDIIQAIEWDTVPMDDEGWLHVSPESELGAAVRELLGNSFYTGDGDSSGPGDGTAVIGDGSSGG